MISEIEENKEEFTIHQYTHILEEKIDHLVKFDQNIFIIQDKRGTKEYHYEKRSLLAKK